MFVSKKIQNSAQLCRYFFQTLKPKKFLYNLKRTGRGHWLLTSYTRVLDLEKNITNGNIQQGSPIKSRRNKIKKGFTFFHHCLPVMDFITPIIEAKESFFS